MAPALHHQDGEGVVAKKGVKDLVMITSGFSADCLETLEEIAVENAEVFKRFGGERILFAIPCLNASARQAC